MQTDEQTSGNWIVVFANPRAGAAGRAEEVTVVADALRARGYQLEVIGQQHALPERVAELHAAGDLRMVVAAGGDGTVRYVVSTIPTGVPVMILPLGTENLLAKYSGVSREVQRWCDTVDRGHYVSWDVGYVTGGDGPPQDFLLMLSCGFDADVVRRLHQQRTGHIRHWSYAKPILDSIRRYQYPELQLRYTTDGVEWHDQTAHWVFAFNIPAYAGGLQIAPSADPGDGLLDVCTFVGASLPSGLFHLGTVMMGQQGDWSNFSHVRARQIRVTAAATVPFQVDGDPGGELPIEVTVVPRRMTLVVAPDWQPPIPTQ